MRFHIQGSDGGDDPVEAFQKQVMPKASVISATGESIAIFKEVQCLTPRLIEFMIRLQQICPLNQIISIPTGVAMISKSFTLSFNSMEKLLITRFLHQLFCDFSFCHIKMVVKCFSW